MDKEAMTVKALLRCWQARKVQMVFEEVVRLPRCQQEKIVKIGAA